MQDQKNTWNMEDYTMKEITRKAICAMQDHSLLGHYCPQELIDRFAEEAIRYSF